MGRLAGTCTVCGRTTIDIYRCRLCGAVVCSRCFTPDTGVCTRCMRRGLWIGSRGSG